MGKRLMGTVEIATMLGLHQTTIIKWIDSGRLKAFKTIGGHRRVEVEGLIGFLKENEMPVPDELAARRRRPRIVIVDDDPAILAVYSRHLARASKEYEIETFQTSIDALLDIGRSVPDIVIVDIFIPDMDGYVLCRRIRENPLTADVAIIAISGRASAGVRAKALAEGADAFYEKAGDSKRLVELVGSILQK